MKNGALVALLLCLSGCQCHREPDPPNEAEAPAAHAPAAANAASDTQAAQSRAEATAQAHAAALAAAVGTVHRYLTFLPGSSRAQADAMWSGGQPPPVPDDANLRQVADIASLRVNNDAPVALDREQPPRAVEVPVRLRLQTQHGERRYTGWYRLRTRVDGQGWEITSASLQPALD